MLSFDLGMLCNFQLRPLMLKLISYHHISSHFSSFQAFWRNCRTAINATIWLKSQQGGPSCFTLNCLCMSHDQHAGLVEGAVLLQRSSPLYRVSKALEED